MTHEKQCSRCERIKLGDCFRPDSRNLDGRHSWCRQCEMERARTYRTSPEVRARIKQYDKLKRSNPEYRADAARKAQRADYLRRTRSRPKSRERERRHAAQYRMRYPEKQSARLTLKRALQSGNVVRPDCCSQCGVSNPKRTDGKSALHGHHHRGYELPLEVLWLCHRCHNLAHQS